MTRVSKKYLQTSVKLVQTRIPNTVWSWMQTRAKKEDSTISRVLRTIIMDEYRRDKEPTRFRCTDCWAEGTKSQLEESGHRPEATPKCKRAK